MRTEGINATERRASTISRATGARAMALVSVASGLVACGGLSQPGEAVEQTREALSSQPWTKVASPFPGGGAGPANVALLTDGSVLVSDPERSDGDPWYRWYRLRPDSTGSYANGTWSTAASSSIGRQFAPAYVLRDGRYFICGGEYTSDPYELAMHTNSSTNRARCEIYDPVLDAWTDDRTAPSLDLGETIADTAAVVLDDGRVLILGNASSNTYAFTASGNSFQWSSPTSLKAYPNALVTPEGSCTLQQDGRVFCAHSGFVRYQPGASGADSWTQLSTSPPISLKSFNGSDYEIGPVLQLYDGSMMVLGADSQTSSNAPPKDAHAAILGAGDTWRMAPPIRATQPNGTPALNHGDTPSIVMSDGRVLVASDSDDAGLGNGGPSALHEFDPSAPGGGSWAAVPNPPSATFTTVGAWIRMLDLPSGEVLVTGTSDGSVWLYKPNGTPASSWRPAISSISGPNISGEYTLTGTQLNGLTVGGGIGDEGMTATNYPIVYLVAGGQRYYARSYNFSHMAPKPNQTSSCNFRLPAGIPNGTYTVYVVANGLSSSGGPSLTVSGNVLAVVATSPTSLTIKSSQMGPATVFLTSSDPSVLTVPASVTIPSSSKVVTVNATVNGFGSAIISASTSNSPSGSIGVRMGWTITSFSGPSVMYGDREFPSVAPWYLTLSAPAPVNAVVAVTSGNTAIASVPATVTVPQGSTSVTVPVTKAGTQRGLARITASARNTARTWTFSDRDFDYYKCADESGQCFSSIFEPYLAYGDNGRVDGRDGHYAYSLATGFSTPCSTSTFGGNPDYGFVKSCYLGVYSAAAQEGQSFRLAGPINVAYGANGAFVYKQVQAGTYTCDTSTFGSVDPAYKVVKRCFIGPDPQAYTWAGDEGSAFSVP